jgi:hypothetical protein
VTAVRRPAPRRPRSVRLVLAVLVAALLAPIGAVASTTPVGAQTAPGATSTTSPPTSATTTPEVSADDPAPSPTTAPTSTTPTAEPTPTTTPSSSALAVGDTVEAPESLLGDVYTPSYAGAPWFRPGVPYNANFPDPTVVWDGSRYWAYATSTGGSLMPAMSSTDLQTWTPRPAYSPNPYNGDPFFNDAFPIPPAWTMGGYSRAGKAQWAPGVAYLGGAWVAYTSWEVAPGRRCISVARASSPQGPFLDLSSQPFICDTDPGGSIDAQPFIDSNGQAYLMWKSSGVVGSQPTRIKARALSADGLSFAPGSSTVVLLQTALGWEGNSIENPSMVRYGGSYWLIYSGNEWESADYRMGQAACAGPLGPCTRTSSAPLLGNTATEWSPGGGTLFLDQSGRLRMIYQVWNAPYTSYPTNPNCDGTGLCASQGQRFYRIDGLAISNGKLTVDPLGSLDQVNVTQGRVQVSGWALDPSTSASIPVHVYIGNSGTAINANLSRPDLAASYPGLGTAHGFNATINAPAGNHTLCAYGINAGAGVNVPIGCKAVYVPGTAPFGALDGATGRPGAIAVGGWAIDPDTTSPIQVHVYVDGRGTPALTANQSRPDVGALYPASGSNHGYTGLIPATPGAHSVCAYAINVGAGSNSLLGCTTAVVPGGSPFGTLDTVRGVSGGVTAAGWAIDPDTGSPIGVHVYVDSTVGTVGVATTASMARADVGAAFPAYGAGHGYGVTVPATPGLKRVCAYGINVGVGATTTLGCRLVIVPDTSPYGSLDRVTGVGGGVAVGGWAIDPDVPTSPVQIHVYVDGVGRPALNANQYRPDVGAAFPGTGSNHGFSATVAATRGSHTVCLYAINVAAGSNVGLGCRAVSVP